MILRGVEAFLRRQREADALYRELRPAPDLAPFVACNWVRVVRYADFAGPVQVVPDGCSDIITCDDGPPILVGPDRQVRSPQLAEGTVITGLRLRPGALRAVIGYPTVELVDSSAQLAELFPAARRLHDDLFSADTLDGRLALLEGWVRARIHARTRDLAVIRACRMLARLPVDVADVARELGWSVRTTHREFVATCGYGPKTMQRILRVQRAIRSGHRTRHPLQLADVAARGGFADQAHMTREFRAITGSPPAHYLAQSVPSLGRWLDPYLADEDD